MLKTLPIHQETVHGRVRKMVLDAVAEPRGCIKTDVILYKHNAGRLNFWSKIENTNKIEITSYYITYNNTEINVLTDESTVYKLFF